MSAETFFSDAQKEAISKTIAEAEAKTSGEIRVHIEEVCKENTVKRAELLFGKLKMHETAERNGVLFYLAIDSRVFAIYGDKGIHEKVQPQFWDAASALMEQHFKEGKFSEGLIAGITMAGEQLSTHFPCKTDDKNELTNDISFK
ncbi:MAG: TPM domain-containing protein [Bacteroidota bacterium]|nr:TPM domain-containing protein [Bacteroidota bacterium]